MGTRGEETRSVATLRTVRLVADLLQGVRHTSASAASMLKLKQAAANRQLKAIARGLPGVVIAKRGKEYEYGLDLGAVAPAPSVAAAIAACLGASLGRLFEGTAYAGGMGSALNEVLRRYRKSRPTFTDIERKFVFLVQGGEMCLPEAHGRLDDLIDAVLNQNPIQITYKHFDGTVAERVVHPLSVIVYAHQLYVMAREPGGLARPFRFSRIIKLEAVPGHFPYQNKAEYDPVQLFADSLGIFGGEDDQFPIVDVDVRIRRKWQVHVASHRWHRSQRVVADGADHLRLLLRVRSCPELEALILGFGADAEVLAPASLRHRIAAASAEMAEIYRRRPS